MASTDINMYSNKQEGASDTDLSVLPKYRFHVCKDEEKFSDGTGRMVPTETSSGYLANERLLLPEDAVSLSLCFSIYILSSCYTFDMFVSLGMLYMFKFI